MVSIPALSPASNLQGLIRIPPTLPATPQPLTGSHTLIPENAPAIPRFIGKRLMGQSPQLRDIPSSGQFAFHQMQNDARRYQKNTIMRNPWCTIGEQLILPGGRITESMIQNARQEKCCSSSELSSNDFFPPDLLPFLGLMEYVDHLWKSALKDKSFKYLAQNIFNAFPHTLRALFAAANNPIVTFNGMQIPSQHHPYGLAKENEQWDASKHCAFNILYEPNFQEGLKIGIYIYQGLQALENLTPLSAFMLSSELTITPAIKKWITNLFDSTITHSFDLFNNAQTPSQAFISQALRTLYAFFDFHGYRHNAAKLQELAGIFMPSLPHIDLNS